ncbi:shikimate kinase [Finegoldia magna]|jgi:shikimate dehydrogenase|uniref:shikimate kinase n=1 Tax=Finegoldia magna TaxID=1260 RepID=UPI0026ECE1C2|nr:shikimate kinase [Finegoldia magna]
MSKVVLEDLGCQSIKIISREDIKNHNIEELIKDTEILINCTPIGVYPLVDESFPVEIKKLIKLKHVIDLNYNPLNTRLMIEANELGCKANSGLSMLVAQGKKAAEIFLNKKIDYDLIDEVERKIRKRLLNIVLIGMPGSGKTVIGRELAHRINREFVDVDNCIESSHKMTVQKMIEEKGITFFRKIEKEVVREELLSFSRVISTGGRVIEDRENWRYLKYNSQVIYIERNLDQLDTKGRPLSQGGIDRLNNIYEKRNPIYKKLSDYRVKNNKNLLETVEEIKKVYEKNFGH